MDNGEQQPAGNRFLWSIVTVLGAIVAGVGVFLLTRWIADEPSGAEIGYWVSAAEIRSADDPETVYAFDAVPLIGITDVGELAEDLKRQVVSGVTEGRRTWEISFHIQSRGDIRPDDVRLHAEVVEGGTLALLEQPGGLGCSMNGEVKLELNLSCPFLEGGEGVATFVLTATTPAGNAQAGQALADALITPQVLDDMVRLLDFAKGVSCTALSLEVDPRRLTTIEDVAEPFASGDRSLGQVLTNEFVSISNGKVNRLTTPAEAFVPFVQEIDTLPQEGADIDGAEEGGLRVFVPGASPVTVNLVAAGCTAPGAAG